MSNKPKIEDIKLPAKFRKTCLAPPNYWNGVDEITVAEYDKDNDWLLSTDAPLMVDKVAINKGWVELVEDEKENTQKQLNYSYECKIVYNNRQEFDAICAALKGIGANGWREGYEECLLSNGFPHSFLISPKGFIDGVGVYSLTPTVTLLEAIQYLMRPTKTQEDVEREQQIEKLKQEIKEKMAMLDELGGLL